MLAICLHTRPCFAEDPASFTHRRGLEAQAFTARHVRLRCEPCCGRRWLCAGSERIDAHKRAALCCTFPSFAAADKRARSVRPAPPKAGRPGTAPGTPRVHGPSRALSSAPFRARPRRARKRPPWAPACGTRGCRCKVTAEGGERAHRMQSAPPRPRGRRAVRSRQTRSPRPVPAAPSVGLPGRRFGSTSAVLSAPRLCEIGRRWAPPRPCARRRPQLRRCVSWGAAVSSAWAFQGRANNFLAAVRPRAFRPHRAHVNGLP